MKRILLLLVLFGLIFNHVDAQRNFAAKKLLFSQVQKPYINYGYLYNWYAATEAKNISASGWHVPTQAEFNTLITYIGGSLQGAKLLSINSNYWDVVLGNNLTGFNLRGSGGRYKENESGSDFSAIREYAALWSSYNGAQPGLYARNDGGVTFDLAFASFKYTGCGVRLLKDITTLTDGEYGTYTGNDGKVYRTVCIGTQEWLADNLAETLYRDLSSIPEVTNNITWVALTAGARCVYNNDESYR